MFKKKKSTTGNGGSPPSFPPPMPVDVYQRNGIGYRPTNRTLDSQQYRSSSSRGQQQFSTSFSPLPTQGAIGRRLQSDQGEIDAAINAAAHAATQQAPPVWSEPRPLPQQQSSPRRYSSDASIMERVVELRVQPSLRYHKSDGYHSDVMSTSAAGSGDSEAARLSEIRTTVQAQRSSQHPIADSHLPFVTRSRPRLPERGFSAPGEASASHIRSAAVNSARHNVETGVPYGMPSVESPLDAAQDNNSFLPSSICDTSNNKDTTKRSRYSLKSMNPFKKGHKTKLQPLHMRVDIPPNNPSFEPGKTPLIRLPGIGVAAVVVPPRNEWRVDKETDKHYFQIKVDQKPEDSSSDETHHPTNTGLSDGNNASPNVIHDIQWGPWVEPSDGHTENYPPAGRRIVSSDQWGE